MRYDKTKLLEKAKPYFRNPEINKLFVTEDGNIFYSNASNYAKAHSKHHDLKLYTIVREDYEGKKEPEVKKEDESTGKKPREIAKELGLNVPGRASNETIQKMIDEHLANNKTE